MSPRRLTFALPLLLLAPCAPHAAESVWTAGSGLVPESACPAWTAGGSGSSLLDQGSLLIQTNSCGDNRYYLQEAPDIAIPDTLIVEAQLSVSQSNECVGPCGHYRGAAAIAVTTAPFVGTLAFVANNEVMLVSDAGCHPAQVASAATGTTRTYTLRIVGGSAVTLSVDGVVVLSGNTYASASDHAEVPRILWGEGSSLTYGTERWSSVRHNAHATGCVPASVVAGGAGIREAWASPNPFRGATMLTYAASRAATVRLEILDAAGRLVRHFEDAAPAPGRRAVAWDGRDDQGRAAEAGVYAYRVTGGAVAQQGRLVKLR